MTIIIITMPYSWWLVFLCVILKGSLGLKDVVLTIHPSTVQRLHRATLRCAYDLEGATLYYVKWYRGTYEFYRYTPSAEPRPKQVFGDLQGIHVDEDHSNSTQVVLSDIDLKLSGNFTCEVTTDEEPASTGTDSASMLVVELPEFPPTISVGRKPLDSGDTLRANCTSLPARPAAHLRFILNNMTVAQTDDPAPRRPFEKLWSDLSLELKLSDFHFDKSGKLILQCVAIIRDVYHEEAVLELESAREPIPERVSAFSSANKNTIVQFLPLIYLALVVKS